MKIVYSLLVCLFFLFPAIAFSQSPGLIVRPLPAGTTTLNPDGNGYSSQTTAGFTTNDIGESEIPYKIVPPAITEPTGDLATGPSGGFTDIVKTVDNSGFYVCSDGTNIFFRLRIGGIISGSKGYSVLIDTDNKMGNNGAYADPNYVAPTNTGNGNPGFEYEVVFQTNFQIAVYKVDGNISPGTPTNTYSLNSNSQISVALSTDGNNPDYFYDWFVPLSAIGNPALLRMAATTVTSPNSALQGSRSDIYGVDDANTTTSGGWQTVVNTQPSISIASISSGGAGVGANCTAAPVLNAPINFGSSVSVTGTWTKMDVSKPNTATITLYQNGSAAGTTSVTSGGTWTITVSTVATGDIFYAKAQATGESQCLQSNNITAGCSSYPVAPTITCASTKGITGKTALGTTVLIYSVTTANASPTATALTTNLLYTNNAADRDFNYFGSNPQSGNACQGQNGILAQGTYMIIASNNGCLSAPTFLCISGASQNSWSYISTNTLNLTTPIYPFQTTINGTGATSGQLLRLFINDKYTSAVTATGTSFSFVNLVLKAGDVLKVYAQVSGTTCMTVSNAFTVNCYNQPPVISTDANGKLLSTATSISGTATANASITLNRTSPTTASWTTTANSSGIWTVSGLTLGAGETYTATVSSSSGCATASAASASASVVAPTTTCPTITSSLSETSTSVSGNITTASTGTVRLYLDDVLEGSFNITTTGTSTWTISSLTYPLYSGGILRASFQAGTNAESTGCTTATISCTPPVAPIITSVSPGTTIKTGESVTFNLSNIAANTWYALSDNTGTSYATSIYTNSTSNLSLPSKTFGTAGDYNLKITADKLTGCTASFATSAIKVNPISLPVNFLNVNAKKNGSGTLVSWVVANETDVLRYEVEKSFDCRNFTPLAQVDYKQPTATTNAYAYQDNNASGNICYRIKQVDVDGHYHYSSIVRINENAMSKTLVAPNPAYDHITINKSSSTNESVKIQLLDANGRLVHETKSTLTPGNNSIEIKGLQRFGRGQYVLKLIGNTSMEYFKVILQ